MAIITAMPSSFKAEVLQAGHCFNATIVATGGTGTNGAFIISGLSSLAGVAVGMAVSGTNVGAGAVVSSIDSASQIHVSVANSGTITSGSITFTGDVIKLALIKHLPTNSYGASNVNYSDLGSDEVTGTGYTAGGLALTNVTPAVSSTTGFTTFNNSPATSWTSATIDMDGAMAYNTNARLGGTSGTNTGGANRAVGVFSTNEQKVTAGTLTITFPTSSPGLLAVQ